MKMDEHARMNELFSSPKATSRAEAERLLQHELETLAEEHPEARVRALPESRLEGGERVDLLLQVEDYDICLQLLDASDGRPTFERDQLEWMLRVLGENPNAVALVVVWTTDDLLSVPLSLRRLYSLRQDPSRLSALLAQARPVAQVLAEVIQRQSRRWVDRIEIRKGAPERGVDVRKEFSREFEAAVEVERERPYAKYERKVAALRYPLAAEREAIVTALDEAMLGARREVLVDLLAQLPKGGAR